MGESPGQERNSIGVEFIDTNVLINALDRSAGPKQVAAKELLRRLTAERRGALSFQVLSEFYSAATAKGVVSDEEAISVIAAFSLWRVHCPAVHSLIESAAIRARYQIHWWDALILNSALELGCTTLWTEDFSDGQKFGALTVRNPFNA